MDVAGRGYIEVHDDEKLIGYVGSVDYGDSSFKLVDTIEEAKKYTQEDLLFHDTMILQWGYGYRFLPKMPFSNI